MSIDVDFGDCANEGDKVFAGERIALLEKDVELHKLRLLEMRVCVKAWLGNCRDRMMPEDVSSLQDILGVPK